MWRDVLGRSLSQSGLSIGGGWRVIEESQSVYAMLRRGFWTKIGLLGLIEAAHGSDLPAIIIWSLRSNRCIAFLAAGSTLRPLVALEHNLHPRKF